MANNFSVKYQGDSFEDWFRANYGTDYTGTGLSRGENMSDADWAIGQKLYDGYKNAKNIDSQYTTSKDTIQTNFDTSAGALETIKDNNTANQNELYNNNISDLERNYGTMSEDLLTERKRAAQHANVTHELMKKYLPEYVKNSGLSGSGVSESTLLSAYSTYANNLGQINSDYAKNKTALDNQYVSTKGDYDVTHSNAIRDIDNAYLSGMADLEAGKNSDLSELEIAYGNQKTNNTLATGEAVQGVFDDYRNAFETNRNRTYTDAQASIAALPITNQAEMDAYIAQYEGKVSEDQFLQLKQLGQAIVRQNAYAETSTAQTTIQELVNEGRFTEARHLLDRNKDIFSEVDYASLLSLINKTRAETVDIEADIEEEKSETTEVNGVSFTEAKLKGNMNTANDDLGDNFTITLGENNYYVEKGHDADDFTNKRLIEAYKSKNGTHPKYGDVVVYNGVIYMYLNNNNTNKDGWCKVQRRALGTGNSFKRLCNELGVEFYERERS